MNESDFVDTVKRTLTEENTFSGESWWQCRFCNESFNASKKLTIHMSSHSEYDNKETKCKDCGNVYGIRKSLWVHRQKKHPRLLNPSPCELCDKKFFDKTELFYHLKTHQAQRPWEQQEHSEREKKEALWIEAVCRLFRMQSSLSQTKLNVQCDNFLKWKEAGAGEAHIRFLSSSNLYLLKWNVYKV